MLRKKIFQRRAKSVENWLATPGVTTVDGGFAVSSSSSTGFSGSFSLESVDYPDYANLMAKNIKNNINARGILFCGTGIGISMAANRFSHIRAALCTSVEMASKSRKSSGYSKNSSMKIKMLTAK